MKKYTRLLIIVSISILVLATDVVAQGFYGKKELTVRLTSFIEAIANPQEIDKVRVSIMGYLFVERDETLLFLDKQGFEKYDLASSIELPVALTIKNIPITRFNLANVEVVGTFRYIAKGNKRYILDLEYIAVLPGGR